MSERTPIHAYLCHKNFSSFYSRNMGTVLKDTTPGGSAGEIKRSILDGGYLQNDQMPVLPAGRLK